jgi:hypothetical protein
VEPVGSLQLFRKLLNSCENGGRVFDTALASHHQVFGPNFANERAAAGGYVTACTPTVDGLLHDQWPSDLQGFRDTGGGLHRTVILMQSFAMGHVPNNWLRY